jgi:1-acyl-sn-glycerol-3-phosphate acyltransferase
LNVPHARIEAFRQSAFGAGCVRAILRYFDARLEGAENIPQDRGALLVANHGPFGFDAFVLGALLAQRGRMPYWLADRHLWKTPGLGRALDFVGAIRGERAPAVELLSRGELVVVYPGGIFDSYKLSTERHRLQWRGRRGFAHVALAAQAPIVPVAACGVDDMYRVLAREPALGRILFGDARYNFPIALGRWGTLLPQPAKIVVHVLPPLEPTGHPDDESAVLRMRNAVESAVQAQLDLS